VSEIPFVNALGDALEIAISAPAPATTPRRWRIGLPRGRGRLLVALAVVGLGGAAFAATQQSEIPLVTADIACYSGGGFNASAYYDVQPNGRSPQAVCAQRFRANGPRALGAPGVKLVACDDPPPVQERGPVPGFVAVFKANGSSRQCQNLGLSPLQTAPYVATALRVRTLVRHLAAAGDNGRCTPPRTLLYRVQRVLRSFGWSGWRAEVDPLVSRPGPCGLFEATGRARSDPAASLDAKRQIVWIVTYRSLPDPH
jgi:hypothetical protein